MPIELTAPLPAQVRLVETPTFKFLGQGCSCCSSSTCLWVGVQCELVGSLPSEAQETIAGP